MTSELFGVPSFNCNTFPAFSEVSIFHSMDVLSTQDAQEDDPLPFGAVDWGMALDGEVEEEEKEGWHSGWVDEEPTSCSSFAAKLLTGWCLLTRWMVISSA